MEDIKKKTFDDELNKSKEDIGESPRKFIPVPKIRRKKGKKENKEDVTKTHPSVSEEISKKINK